MADGEAYLRANIALTERARDAAQLAARRAQTAETRVLGREGGVEEVLALAVAAREAIDNRAIAIEETIADNVPTHEWDGTKIRLRNPNGTWGAWVELKGAIGQGGWSPVLATVTDGARKVLKVESWIGGTGAPPSANLYVGASGLVPAVGDGATVGFNPDSIALTGVPTAPTAAPGTNTTQIATTAYTTAAIAVAYANLLNLAPAALDTLYELAAALGNDPSFSTTMVTALAGKQASHGNLSALAGLSLVADKLAYANGAGTLGLADFTSAARTLLAQTSQATLRTNGLGMSADGSSFVSAANYAAMLALLAAFTGDSGAGGVKGLVPAPAAGDAAALKFLKADGTWAAPGGASWSLVQTNVTTSGTTSTFSSIAAGQWLQFLFVGVSHADTGSNQTLQVEVSNDNGVSWTSPTAVTNNFSNVSKARGALLLPDYRADQGQALISNIFAATTALTMSANTAIPAANWIATGGINAVRFSWTGGAAFDDGAITARRIA